MKTTGPLAFISTGLSNFVIYGTQICLWPFSTELQEQIAEAYIDNLY